jgi:hypothetical protein
VIAADTSTWIAFLEGTEGEDTQLLDRALEDRQVRMVPEIASGYWQRAPVSRAKVLAKRRKARLGDALIAQSCIDRGISLLTRDRDFRTFAEAAGLGLVLGS